MPRAQRLLDLLQALRRHRRPVRGQVLAETLGVSLRTLYRDIATLQAQGATIEGDAGIGYALRPGCTLPPLMFTPEEIEALVLGSRWVAENEDDELAEAAQAALSKIAAVMPANRRDDIETAALLAGPSHRVADADAAIASLRKAIQAERRVSIAYRDQYYEESQRTIWPIALSYFSKAQVVVAWCELRGDFRQFRPDRIAAMVVTETRYPRRRAVLLKEWESMQGNAND